MLLLIVCLCALPAPARAYRTLTELPELADANGQPVPWRAFPIELVVFEQAEDPLTGAQTLDALAAGAEIWNQSQCTANALQVGGLTDAAAIQQDMRNTVQWVHSDWSTYGPSDAVAITQTVYRSTGGRYTLIEADVYINADTVSWSAAMTAHLDGVLAHELGHVLGLAHPCEVDGAGGAPLCDSDTEITLMHPLYDASSGALTADDENGACFLYPNGPVDMSEAPDGDGGSGGCAIATPGATRSPGLTGLGAALALFALLRKRRHPARSVHE